jgi:four helix bundle protein
VNFREAHRARSDAEFDCKVGDCLKELEETCYCLQCVIDEALVSADRLAPLPDKCNELMAIPTTVAKKVKPQAY